MRFKPTILNEKCRRHFGARETVYGCTPEVSQTLVGTAALFDPIFKVEIKVTAHL